MPEQPLNELSSIPVDSVRVLNPRDRNQRVFETIVESIKKVGLKKPILVTPRTDADGQAYYQLVCGEGRLSAFRKLGIEHIPALLIQADNDEAYIKSLLENVARRQYRPLEILSGIRQLSEKGYSPSDISRKTGLTPTYVAGILRLLSSGEERLLVAVERGAVPLNTALDIVSAGNDDAALQAAMQEAYETGALRGNRLKIARRLIERRRTLGVSMALHAKRKNVDVSSSSLVRVYEREVERKKLVLKKAEITQQRLLFVVSALRRLLGNEHFVTLLRAEGLDVMPRYLAERVWPERLG